MAKILREADAASVPEVGKRHGVSDKTIYGWRRHLGGPTVPHAKHLKQLEAENALRKRLLAERDLEIEVMKEISAKKWSARPPVEVGPNTPVGGACPVAGLRASSRRALHAGVQRSDGREG